MGLSLISNTYFRTGHHSLITAVQAGMAAIALQAIQKLGTFAQTTTFSDSNTEELNAEVWQKQYTSRVNALTEMSRNITWVWPKTQADWDRINLMATKTEESSSLTCEMLSSISKISLLFFHPSNVLSFALPILTSVTSTFLHDTYCHSLSTYHQALLDCKSSSSGLDRCITADPQKRKAALEVLAATIETVLPHNAEESKYLPVKDCVSSGPCFDIDKGTVHERESKAAETAYTTKAFKNKREELKSWFASHLVPPEWQDVQEVLRFRSDDPREKFLFIVAESDHNGAFNASNISGMLSKLSQKFDLRFQVVKNRRDICKAIESGAKTENLAHVLIGAHGTPRLMEFDVGIDSNGKPFLKDGILEWDSTYFSRCFSGLRPDGKIFLLSCSTGGMKDVGTKEKPKKSGLPFDNIAQKIANAAKRVVVAPRDVAHSSWTNFLSNDDVLYEHENILYSFLPFYSSNLYSSFRPIFKKCFPNIEKIHSRESSALDVIRTNLISRSLLHKDEPPSRANEYLQICSDDPRKKLLFFVAEHDKNDAIEPKFTPATLGLFADRFDLQYKVVKSSSEICQSIDQAAKAGSIANVIILSHGTATDGMLLSKDANGKEIRLDKPKYCFSKIEKEGTIVLMGGSLGQNGDDKNNIAQKIANKAQRTVLAASCPIFPDNTKIQSLNPLMMEHPKYSGMYNFFLMGCSENNANHFKAFHPIASETKAKEEV